MVGLQIHKASLIFSRERVNTVDEACPAGLKTENLRHQLRGPALQPGLSQRRLFALAIISSKCKGCTNGLPHYDC